MRLKVMRIENKQLIFECQCYIIQSAITIVDNLKKMVFGLVV